MKVGILTLHRANNYGAALQCYALQETLSQLGHDAWVIDYRQPDTEISYRPVSFKRMVSHLTRPIELAKDIFHMPLFFKNAKKFNAFRSKYLKCTQPIYNANDMPQDFDVYVIGSDQLWSMQCMGGHVEKVFWGDFPHPASSRVIGYAISANVDSLNMIGRDWIIKELGNFHSLSVREQGIADWLMKNAGITPRVDIDPTLLLEPQEWNKFVGERPIDEKYLVSYFLLPNQKQEARMFAKRLGLKYVEIGKVAHSPAEFLTWIRHADFVLGGSFHIAVFSIIFQRKFFIIKKNSSFDIRSESLLNTLGFRNCFVQISELSKTFSWNDNSLLKTTLTQYKKKALEYIMNWN